MATPTDARYNRAVMLRQQRDMRKQERRMGNQGTGTGQDLLRLLHGVRMEMTNPTPAPLNVTSLQGQLDLATRVNISMQQTIVQQNQDITVLRTQAQTLQTTIDGLNSSIVSLRAQLAVLPALQTQISSLEAQVAALRMTLDQILTLI